MNKRARLNYIHALSTQVEHKKMYKAKKQWVVAGMSFLVAAGLGAVSSHLTTHAQVTNTKPQVTSGMNQQNSGKAQGKLSSASASSVASQSVSAKAKSNVRAIVANNMQHGSTQPSSVNSNSNSTQDKVPSTAPMYKTAKPNSAYANYLKEMGGSSAYNQLMNNEANKQKNTQDQPQTNNGVKHLLGFSSINPNDESTWPGQMYVGNQKSKNVHSDAVYNVPSDVKGSKSIITIAEGIHDTSANYTYSLDSGSLKVFNEKSNNNDGSDYRVVDSVNPNYSDRFSKSLYNYSDFTPGNLGYQIASHDFYDAEDPNATRTASSYNTSDVYSDITYTKIYHGKNNINYGYVPKYKGWINLGSTDTPSSPWHLADINAQFQYKNFVTSSDIGNAFTKNSVNPSDYLSELHDLPSGYSLATHGDNPNSSNITNYEPQTLSASNVNDIYLVPNNVTNYGYWGTAHYVLDNQGNLYLLNGTLSDPNNLGASQISGLNQITNKVKHIHTYNVTTPVNSNSLFWGLNASDIDLSGLNTSSTTNFNWFLNGNVALKHINMPIDTSKASDMWGFFNGLNNIQSITIGNNTKLFNVNGHGSPFNNMNINWVNSQDQPINLSDDTNPIADTYYNSSSYNKVTVDVNYTNNGKNVNATPTQISVAGTIGNSCNINDQVNAHIPNNYKRTTSSDITVKMPQALPKGWLPTIRTDSDGFWHSDTAQPVGSTDKAPANSGWHEYLSADGKTLTLTGDMKKYNGHGLSSRNVTTVNLGNVVNLVNASDLFGMPKLQTIKQVGDFDTSHTTSMADMFGDASDLTNIDALANWNTKNVTNTTNMFYGCSKLADISPLADWNTSNDHNMSEMFSGDTSLTNINMLANWNTNSVSNMSRMFDSPLYNSTPIQGWNIDSSGTPNGNNIDNDTNVGGVQQSGNPSVWNTTTGKWTGNPNNPEYSGKGLTSVDVNVPVKSFPKATVNIVYSDNGKDVSTQNNIQVIKQPDQTITIPANELHIPSHYLRNNKNQITTTMPAGIPANWFAMDSKTGFTAQPADTTDVAPQGSGWHAYLSKDSKTVTVTGDFTNYTYGENGGSNAGLDGNSNSALSNVTTLNLGNVTNLQNARLLLANMGSLTNIQQVGNFDTSHVTTMYDMLSNDYNLSDLSALASWNTSDVTNMKRMFYSDGNITNLAPLAHWNTSNVTNMDTMFCNDYKLNDITPLGSWNTNNVQFMSYMFHQDGSLDNSATSINWNLDQFGTPNGSVINQNGNSKLWNKPNNLNSMTLANDDNVFVHVPVRHVSQQAAVDINYSDNGKIVGHQSGIIINGDPGDRIQISDGTLQIPAHYERTSDSQIYINMPQPVKPQKFVPTPEPANTQADMAPADSGWHAYLSDGGTTLTVTGDFTNYNYNGGGNYGLDWNDNHNLGNVKTVNLGNAENLTDMSAMFDGMTSLQTVNKSNGWNTHNVTNFGQLFQSDYHLSNIAGLANWDVSNASVFGQMFKNDHSLEDLSPLAHWNTANVTNMLVMFQSDNIQNYAPLINNWIFKNNPNYPILPTTQYTDGNWGFDSSKEPSLDVTDNLVYMNDGQVVGSGTIQGNRYDKFIIGDNPNGLPINYTISKPNQQFGYGDNTDYVYVNQIAHVNVPVKLVSQQATVNINYSDNGKIVGHQTGIIVKGNLGDKVQIPNNVLQAPSYYERTNDNPIYIDMPQPIKPQKFVPTPKPANTKADMAPANSGWHAYLSDNGTTLTVTGDFKNYNFNGNGGTYGLDWQDNRTLRTVKQINLGNAENLTDMSAMFDGITNLKKFNKSNGWNTHNVTNFGQLFQSDKNLSDITGLANWDISNATVLGQIFQNDPKIHDLSPLAHWNTTKVDNLYYMFMGDNQLTSLDYEPLVNNWIFKTQPEESTMPTYRYTDGNWGFNKNKEPSLNVTDNLIYMNNGQVVGSGTIQGNRYDKFNIGNNPDGLPVNYTISNPNQQFGYGDNTDYVYVNQIANFNVPVTGLPISNITATISLNFVTKDANGNQISDKTNNISVPINSKYGDTVRIPAITYGKSGYKINLSDWKLNFDPQSNNNVIKDLDNLNHTFTYTGISAGPITINYIDTDSDATNGTPSDNGKIVGSHTFSQLGNVGQQVTLSANSTNPNLKLVAPDGYTFASPNASITINLAAPKTVGVVLMAMPTKHTANKVTQSSTTKSVMPKVIDSNKNQVKSSSDKINNMATELISDGFNELNNIKASDANNGLVSFSSDVIPTTIAKSTAKHSANYKVIKLPMNKLGNHFRWIKLRHGVHFYDNLLNVGRKDKHYIKKHIHLKHGKKLHVEAMYLVHGKHHSFLRFKVRIGHHSYFITGNSKFIKFA